jgi:hypothetical protein
MIIVFFTRIYTLYNRYMIKLTSQPTCNHRLWFGQKKSFPQTIIHTKHFLQQLSLFGPTGGEPGLWCSGLQFVLVSSPGNLYNTGIDPALKSWDTAFVRLKELLRRSNSTWLLCSYQCAETQLRGFARAVELALSFHSMTPSTFTRYMLTPYVQYQTAFHDSFHYI